MFEITTKIEKNNEQIGNLFRILGASLMKNEPIKFTMRGINLKFNPSDESLNSNLKYKLINNESELTITLSWG